MKRQRKLASAPPLESQDGDQLAEQILRNVEGLVQLQVWQRTLTETIRRDCERFRALAARKRSLSQ